MMKVQRRSIVTAARKLADLLKLPLIDRSNVTPDETRRIWAEYHSSKPECLGKSIEPWRLEKIIKNSENNPMFMFPVHRTSGFFSLVSQFQKNVCMLTTLEQFQHRRPDTVPMMTVTFYDELCATKAVGLVRADIVSVLTVKEAETILDRLMYFYSSAEFNLVRDFNHRPREFDLNKYIRDSR
uniref:ATP11 protein n=1 Tax=Spongospora subterranea TaxID=70186 RepID=A0A0H5RB94_9EUKA|eukprot:CRZ11480.1 hypothetical protein [Spongospora subterranea]